MGTEICMGMGIEIRLQEGVEQAIERLALAGIKIWVLTGDKQARNQPVVFYNVIAHLDRPCFWGSSADKHLNMAPSELEASDGCTGDGHSHCLCNQPAAYRHDAFLLRLD